MNIAIDCADLDHSRIDGTRVYIKQLLDWFGKLDKNNNFMLYHQTSFNKELKPATFENYNERKIKPYWWWTQTVFAADLRYSKPDVCWMPIQQVPFIGPRKTKYVVTIHDLAFKFFPRHFPKKDLWKLNFFTDSAINRADKIIAISNATKKDILRLYPKIKGNKIHVVQHGFDVQHFSKKRNETEILKIKERLKILNNQKDKYLLYVGALQPRKDLVTLVKAFEKIKKDSANSNLKLILAGEVAWMADGIIAAVKESDYSKEIILTGKVTFEDLAVLYQIAEIFVFPSLYEGFGIPILESFASGTPVVTADNSSLIEVGGNAAKFFKTGEIASLEKVLLKILKSSKIKEEMITSGIKRAKEFSWKESAKKTLNILKEI